MRSSATFLGALAIGSVVAADPAGWSPFGPAKWLVISSAGCIAGAVALWHRHVRLDRRTWWLWSALIALLGLSATVNGDVRTAWLGQPDRHLGVVTWLLFWLLFSAGQTLDERGRRRVLTAIAIAGAALGTYASVELVAGRPIDIASTSRRLTGPYGSAAFLGAAACLLLPVTIGVARDRERGPRARLWATGAAALIAVALVGSGSRAAGMGLVLAGALAIVVGTARRTVADERFGNIVRSATRSRVARLVLGIAACVVIVLAVALAPRVEDVLHREHGAASRIDEWKVAVRVIAEHPLLGVGPEGYRLHVGEGVDAHYERAYGRNTTLPDRAHSGPLDVALAGGLGAAFAFVALIGVVVSAAVRTMRRGQPAERWLAIGLVAYAVQQLFLFPLAEVDPVFWLLAGFLVAPARAAEDDTGPTGRGTRLVSVVAAIGALIALTAGVLDSAADRLAASALDGPTATDDAITDAERAVRLRPDVIMYRLIAADALLRRGTLADVDRALAQTRAALRWSPHDPFALDEHGIALLRRATITGGVRDVTAALQHWSHLVGLDPHRARWQFQLGRAAALAGDSARARAAWTTALTLDPDNTATATLLRALPADG